MLGVEEGILDCGRLSRVITDPMHPLTFKRERETAFRKSADFGEIMQSQPEQVEKSLWDGRFLKKSDLF